MLLNRNLRMLMPSGHTLLSISLSNWETGTVNLNELFFASLRDTHLTFNTVKPLLSTYLFNVSEVVLRVHELLGWCLLFRFGKLCRNLSKKRS